MNQSIFQKLEVSWEYPVYFTENLFDEKNRVFLEAICRKESDKKHRFFIAVDDNVAKAHPGLEEKIFRYVSRHSGELDLVAPIFSIPGGEAAKNEHAWIENIHQKIHSLGLCRQSFVVAIGGGAVLDMVGYASSTPHRGLRLIRIPTTVLSQNDSGVGVKNAINAFGKKNFLGTFAPPFSVINDSQFLLTLSQRDWICGVTEAIKVALLKSPDFFSYLEQHAPLLVNRDISIMQNVVYNCAELHLKHIRTAGDPFEFGHSRPLDFGHWSAHKLESLSQYRLRHGEAVACGIALDTLYSVAMGFFPAEQGNRVIHLFQSLGFSLYQPEMEQENFLHGLAEFREHLGGILCIPLLSAIGSSFEVKDMDAKKIQDAVFFLKKKNL